MIIFKIASDLSKYILNKKLKNSTIGFVPTMGALHQGHISLIEKCKENSDISVCSIFVNPTQFNDVKDFEKYPITLENDIFLLEKAGCDILFLPSVNEIYIDEALKNKTYNLGFIETIFEGEHRPGHFNGVCMVVERLLNIVEPDYLFLGQKDYQQCIVIKKLINLMKVNIAVIVCETERDDNGLAMSSRNKRLSDQSKMKANIIYESFVEVKQQVNESNAEELIQKAKHNLLQNGFEKIDYLSLANAETLEPINSYSKKIKTVVVVAAFINGIRLIDNLKIN